MIFAVLALCLVSSEPATALVNVTTIERASNVTILKSTTGAVSSVIVYGGLSGESGSHQAGRCVLPDFREYLSRSAEARTSNSGTVP